MGVSNYPKRAAISVEIIVCLYAASSVPSVNAPASFALLKAVRRAFLIQSLGDDVQIMPRGQ